MIKLRENIDVAVLLNYGFRSYKANRERTYYYIIAENPTSHLLDVVITDNIDRVVAVETFVDGDIRLHKHICYKRKQRPAVVDILVELAVEGVIING